MTARTYAEEQYIHLVRLAWELRCLGHDVTVDLALSKDSAVIVRRAPGTLRVMATMRGRNWVFTWGRGRGQWVVALDQGATLLIHKAARG